MKAASIMKHKGGVLLRPYQAALGRYLKQGAVGSLKPAMKLGRQAVALGLETLDLALIHEQAVMARLPLAGTATIRNRMILRARKFFAEAIVAMEETHRSALEANVHLSRLNKGLSRRTLDLATSNRLLKKEIARRQRAEGTLRKSEQHTRKLLGHSRQLQDQLRHLSRRILLAQEEERKRISRELHDVIAQMLTGINIRLATLKMEAAASTKGLSQKISRTQRMVEKSVDRVHRFARELRPAVLDDLGLVPALHSYLKIFAEETGIRTKLTAFAGLEKLSGAKRTVLYRVAQEALTNAAGHAQASQVDVDIRRVENAVCMQVRDDGKGFEVSAVKRSKKSPHLGLLGMRERVEMVRGRFTIQSTPGKGTVVQADIPFHNGDQHPRRT
jgi:signal transduction histidine kinase